MSKKERLDKILSNLGYGSRKEIKKEIKAGIVEVDGEIIKDNSFKVDPYESVIKFDNVEIEYREFIYLMLNKPSGVVSATEDSRDETVVDLIDYKYRVFEPFPVGRLDKDTEGLLLLTNDGKLAHNLLSPKKQVDKKYYAEVSGKLDGEDIEKFLQGIDIGEKNETLPAKLFIEYSGQTSKCHVIIREGKYHQVKRMFESLGKKVIYLKRVQMGDLVLDSELELGEYRELNEKELDLLNR